MCALNATQVDERQERENIVRQSIPPLTTQKCSKLLRSLMTWHWMYNLNNSYITHEILPWPLCSLGRAFLMASTRASSNYWRSDMECDFSGQISSTERSSATHEVPNFTCCDCCVVCWIARYPPKPSKNRGRFTQIAHFYAIPDNFVHIYKKNPIGNVVFLL